MGNLHMSIRRFRLQIFNAEIPHHVLIAKYFDYNMCGISIQNYRNRMIFRVVRDIRFV